MGSSSSYSGPELEAKIQKSHEAFLIHSKRRPGSRADIIGSLGGTIEKNRKDLS